MMMSIEHSHVTDVYVTHLLCSAVVGPVNVPAVIIPEGEWDGQSGIWRSARRRQRNRVILVPSSTDSLPKVPR